MQLSFWLNIQKSLTSIIGCWSSTGAMTGSATFLAAVLGVAFLAGALGVVSLAPAINRLRLIRFMGHYLPLLSAEAAAGFFVPFFGGIVKFEIILFINISL